MLREVFGGAADFADTAPGLADALQRALGRRDEARAAAGAALATRYTWAAAADARLDRYRALLGR